MKLYTCDPAPNPLRLKRFMDYKGITLDTTQIDLASEEQLGDAYRAIVPEATVPALILDDGTVLSAVIAIVHYLELLFPEKPLLGVTAEQKATILNWNHRIFGEVFGPIADVFRNGHPKYAGRALPGPADVAQIPELVERGSQRLQDAFVMLNSVLSQQPFLAGETLSFADIDLLVAIDFAKWGARTSPDASLEHVQRWRENTEAALLS
jgi:glutathione S-transferase